MFYFVGVLLGLIFCLIFWGYNKKPRFYRHYRDEKSWYVWGGFPYSDCIGIAFNEADEAKYIDSWLKFQGIDNS